jgi:hypothetical protein
MIGHALVHAPRHAVHPVSERWVAAGFAVGALCFFAGALMLARHDGGTNS